MSDFPRCVGALVAGPASLARQTLLLVLFTTIALAAGAGLARADRGVGVNLGRIHIDDLLKPGGAYNLPVLGVVNTGDEVSDYQVLIGHLEGNTKRRPAPAWFDFQPNRFSLEPGGVQNVKIRLALPTGAEPGDYFAYIEAHLVTQQAGATVGAAAATELSFAVTPSSWLQSQRVRFNRFVDDGEPWTYLAPVALLIAIALVYLRRSFRIRLRVERK